MKIYAGILLFLDLFGTIYILTKNYTPPVTRTHEQKQINAAISSLILVPLLLHILGWW